MVLDDGEIRLNLYRKVRAKCHRCGRKGRGWSYRSECKRYNVDVACVREMIVESWYDIYVGEKDMMNNMKVPRLRNVLQSSCGRSKGKNKVKKCCEIAGLVVQFVISAVLGDPTVVIAGVVGSLMSS